jgi:hypothetical protein
MSEAKRGKKASPETIARIAASLLGNQYAVGHKHTAEVRAKMTAERLERWADPVYRAKMCAARAGCQRGMKHSPERVAHMVAGKKRVALARGDK